MFVNREAELQALDRWWGTPGARMAVVWGRRRVGKSWLLRHWAASRRGLVHVARTRPVVDELAALSRAVQDAVGAPARRDLASRPLRDWDEAFDVLADLSEREPLLLAIDEFPELLRASPHLDSALRAIWERVEGSCQLRLVLCGSAVRAMEAMQAQDAPLYNRMTLRLQLQPFHPYEVGRMLPQAPPTERARAWGVCGGLPYYLAAWDASRPFRDNIDRLFCDEHALLLDEGEFVLSNEEVAGGRRERLPEQVVRAVASGRTSFGAVRSVVSTLPTRTLNDLVALRLLDRVQPVTEKASTKLSYYRIADNFLAFWLAVVERHRPAIEQGLGHGVADVVVEEFDDHMGPRWEEAVRQHVRSLASGGDLGPAVVAVGEFWRTRVGPAEDPCQLDVVALSGRQRRVTLVGEAKWTRSLAAPRILAGVQGKVATAGLALTADPTWLVAARESVTAAPPGCLTVTTDDVFG